MKNYYEKLLLGTLGAIIAILLIVVIFVYSNVRDRHSGYEVDIRKQIPKEAEIDYVLISSTQTRSDLSIKRWIEK